MWVCGAFTILWICSVWCTVHEVEFVHIELCVPACDPIAVHLAQKETDTPAKGKKGKAKRSAKAGTRRRGAGNPATDPGPPVAGALKRIDQWPGLEDDSLVSRRLPERSLTEARYMGV